MSIKLTLDAPALRALIADDNEIILELRAAIVAEVVRNTVLKDKVKLAEEIAPSTFKALVQATEFQAQLSSQLEQMTQAMLKRNWSPARLSPETREKLNVAVNPYMDELMKQLADKAQSLMDEAAAKAFQTIEERIDARVDRLTNEYINKIVNKRVADRLTEALRVASEAA